jgi:hypothetical protein
MRRYRHTDSSSSRRYKRSDSQQYRSCSPQSLPISGYNGTPNAEEQVCSDGEAA